MTARWLVAAVLLGSACQVDSRVGSNRIALRDAAPPAPDGAPQPACLDQMDNDGDGAKDYPFDPGCASYDDDDETDPEPPPACSNGDDDDDDDITDFPLEPGCEAASDDTELDPAEPPECNDGVDNDFSGEMDYPDDIGCHAVGDPIESTLTN